MAKKEKPKPKTRDEYLAMKAKQRKKIKNNILIAIGVLILLTWYGMQPLVATMEYGLCKTYVELQVQYPGSLRLTEYDVYGKSTRIFYTHRDASGSTRSEMTECVIVPHPQIGYIAESIKTNRVEISEAALIKFNKSIPGILAAEPNLQIPARPEQGNLHALQPQEPTFLQ
ncbi:MAG TPA: hypothetical protein EYG18_09805 [Micavibrio sp.]|jgi:hypothetical protein|nr:hypothetical protein [Micavibrio sp.]HIL29550.1 hypothetical protein [Micavibrio sp.]